MTETHKSREPHPHGSTVIAGEAVAPSQKPNPSLRALAHTIASRDYIGVLIATVVLTSGIGIVHPNFLAFSQLLDILNQAAFVAILACGMAFLLAMRELDLSVGSIYGLTSLCAAMLMHAGVPSWLGALTGLVL